MTAITAPRPGQRRAVATHRPDRRRDTRRPGDTHRSGDTARSAARPITRRRPRVTQPHDWFATQLLLVLSGQRPVHALLGHTLGGAYDQLVHLAARSPLRPTEPGHPAPVVSAVGAFQPRRGAVEAFARIAIGSRLRALAFRLECGRNGRWLCSAVELDTTG